jgi:tetratricopeptide (TPR) repeat protein
MCRDILNQMESSSDKLAREERERRASVYITMANVLRGDGRYLDSIDYLQQAYDVYLQLSEESPDDPRYLLNRDMSSLDMGLIWIDLGQPNPARPLFEQSIASLEKLSDLSACKLIQRIVSMRL